MAVNDQIEQVRGNIVGISSSSNGVANGLSNISSSIADELANAGGSRLADLGLSESTTADSLIGDSLRCRLQELGGSILDLIEDGFGLGDLLNDFKMPDLSEIGDKLSQLNPLNLLDKLGDVSLESITNKVGELINDAVGFIGDVITKTFQGVERAMKGIGDMFDEFGDRVVDLGEYVQDAITGIVGGVGQVLQDVTQGIEGIVDSLLAPCPKPSKVASEAANQALQSDKDMFDTDIEIVHGNIVGVNSMAQTTGQFTSIVQSQATAAVTTTTGSNVIPLAADLQDVRKDATGENLPDAELASVAETNQRVELQAKTTALASENITDAVITQVEEQQAQGDQEQTKTKLTATDETGENVSVESVFDQGECVSVLKQFDIQYARVEDLLDVMTNSSLTYSDGEPSGYKFVPGKFYGSNQTINNLIFAYAAKRPSGERWFMAISGYPVYRAIREHQQDNEWPKSFLNRSRNNYGVIEPKHMNSLVQSDKITSEMVQSDQTKLMRCIEEHEQILREQAIAALDPGTAMFAAYRRAEIDRTDRSGRILQQARIMSFNDKFTRGQHVNWEQTWGGHQIENAIELKHEPDGISRMYVDILPLISTNPDFLNILNETDEVDQQLDNSGIFE